MKLKIFEHFNPTSIDEAVSVLGQYDEGKAFINAGGTDLVGTLRFKILPDYPEAVVSLRSIPDLEYIKEEGGQLKIGAMTRLEDIAKSSIIQDKWMALSEAAHKTASPHIREAGTIGGNICQLNRCWYFRKKNNFFNCVRKGGNLCYATLGVNHYHSIFGGIAACVAVNPSDTAPALVVLDATIVTSKREIAVENFWEVTTAPSSTALDTDEIVTEIRIPEFSGKSAFVKMAERASIDFPVVNCAAAINNGDAKICLNAVYNIPYRAIEAEEAIAGMAINEENAEAAGNTIASKTVPLPNNKWKIPIAKTMVKRAILGCA